MIIFLYFASEKATSYQRVVICASVTGRFDAMATVMFNEQHTYHDFIMNKLKEVEGLIFTETFNIIDAPNNNLRYVF